MQSPLSELKAFANPPPELKAALQKRDPERNKNYPKI